VRTWQTVTWQTVRDNIRRSAKYLRGWDSHDGLPATPEAVKKALQWATTFEAVGFPPPLVALCSNGEFNFEWGRYGHTVSVDTDGDTDDRFAAFYIEPTKPTSGG
jgi:hypothetical protein